jgi:hypothetical protein
LLWQEKAVSPWPHHQFACRTGTLIRRPWIWWDITLKKTSWDSYAMSWLLPTSYSVDSSQKYVYTDCQTQHHTQI